MLIFRYLAVFCLIGLMTIDQTESWTRRRSSRSRGLSRGLGRAIKVAGTVITVASMARRFRDFFRRDRKRSAESVIPDVDICRFNTVDLNDDNTVTKEELDTLMQSTGLEELEELFEQLDQNNDDIVTKEEYMDLYEEVCTGDLIGDTQQNSKLDLKREEYTEETD
ncbi:uncharacterized protein LOC133190832 [Saccostrea echinata]|uniref:uncharacterized protein LOC133190832 n=1 Tax=Saccostrea echinata TaxID=191078 RepID=UPI002A8083EB|nr:uncharacterized protein LOC133190832 [Saccostrea echinata]